MRTEISTHDTVTGDSIIDIEKVASQEILESENFNDACKNIKEASDNIQKIIISVSVIDMEQFNRNTKVMNGENQKRIEQMGKTFKSGLESAGFNPSYSN